jgi:hypothetical protein
MKQLAALYLGLGISMFAGCVAEEAPAPDDPAPETHEVDWPCESWDGASIGNGRHMLLEWDAHHNLSLQEDDGWYENGKPTKDSLGYLHTWKYDPTGRVAIEEAENSPPMTTSWRRVLDADAMITSVFRSSSTGGGAPRTSTETSTYYHLKPQTRQLLHHESGLVVRTAFQWADNNHTERADADPEENLPLTITTFVNHPWTQRQRDIWQGDDDTTTRTFDSTGRVLVEERRTWDSKVFRTVTERKTSGAPMVVRETGPLPADITTVYGFQCPATRRAD